jgi:hypothetical protein
MNSDQGTDQMFNNTALNASGHVIKVYPNNIDDTQNLIDAFNQATANRTVVKLMPGTFKIDMIEVKEFNGTLTGSGKEKTFITNLPELSLDAVIALNKVPALITFIGGDVAVSDLSIKVSKLNWTSDLPYRREIIMLLFSDYSPDHMPSIPHIKVNVNNIEIIGLDIPDPVEYRAVIFRPDRNRQSGTRIPRSNIDATVTNSKFLKSQVFVWGCKSGNFMFSNNIFSQFEIQENMGVTVKIMENKFSGAHHLDLNAWESGIFEYITSNVGTYEIRDNIFIGMGFGLWDNWRYDHPENLDWMRMIWDHNTFKILENYETVRNMFGLKDAVFSNNIFVGDAQSGYIGVHGSWCPNVCPMWSEGCQFLNNVFIQKNFVIELDQKTKDFLIKGNLKNVTVIDNGFNNKVIEKTN